MEVVGDLITCEAGVFYIIVRLSIYMFNSELNGILMDGKKTQTMPIMER